MFNLKYGTYEHMPLVDNNLCYNFEGI